MHNFTNNIYFSFHLQNYHTQKMTKFGLYLAATWTIFCTCGAMPDVSILKIPSFFALINEQSFIVIICGIFSIAQL